MSIKSPFPHPYWQTFQGVGKLLPSKEERLIQAISQTIRVKESWKAKIKDDAILAKWMQEIHDEFANSTDSLDDVIEYVFKELDWIERTEASLGFDLGPDEKIVTTDQNSPPVVDEAVKRKLQQESRKLAASFEEVDYHPGTTQVVDLVHPSLFPLQYGLTPLNPADGKLAIAQFSQEITLKKGKVAFGISEKYQWLPAIIKLDEHGQFQFRSYINNLHPIKYAELYKSIAEVFNSAVPALNFSLSFYASGNRTKIQVPHGASVYPRECLQAIDAMWSEEYKKEKEDKEYKIDYSNLGKLERAMKDECLKPLVVSFDEDPKPAVQIDLKKFDHLKVIVKMANIELTPENPRYPGGTWHVEGSINEDIVATVLYYYDSENISKSTLSFRSEYDEPYYQQDDATFMMKYYGLQDGDPMCFKLGSTETAEDRIVVFPNFFQHHVDPFELVDGSKPGHRKILCFFLVDPYDDIAVSTKDVPPQQEEWWADPELEEYIPEQLKTDILSLKNGRKWPQTLTEAKKTREDLMAERGLANPSVSEEATIYFSLCEH